MLDHSGISGRNFLDFVSILRGSVTWIGGALAGLTALCYGAGYFSLQAYLRMLGLSGIVDVRPEHMLIEGSRFWLQVVTLLLQYSAYAVILVIVGGGIFAIFRELRWVSQPLRFLHGQVAAGGNALKLRFPKIGSATALITLFAVLVYHWNTWFDAVNSLSGVRDLLFSNPSSSGASCARLLTAEPVAHGRLVAAIVVHGEPCAASALQGEFAMLIRGYFLLFPLCFVVFGPASRSLSQRAAIISRVAAGVYFAVYTLSLPAAFGVLMHEPAYPQVAITGPGIEMKGLRLMQDSAGILIWNAGPRRTEWLPTRRLDQIDAGQPRNIFPAQQEPSR